MPLRQRAQGQVIFGFWEVPGVEPGRSIRVRERLTAEERVVFGRSASRRVRVGSHLVARLVDWDGDPLFCGTWPPPSSPREADQLVDVARINFARMLRYPKKRTLRPDETRDPRASAILLQLAEEASRVFDAAPPPTLVNTDGAPLVPCEDRFTFHPRSRAALVGFLQALEGVEADSDPTVLPARFVMTRPGDARHEDWDNTLIAGLEPHGARLEVSTHSFERADGVRGRLERSPGRDPRALFRARVGTLPSMHPLETVLAEAGHLLLIGDSSKDRFPGYSFNAYTKAGRPFSCLDLGGLTESRGPTSGVRVYTAVDELPEGIGNLAIIWVTASRCVDAVDAAKAAGCTKVWFSFKTATQAGIDRARGHGLEVVEIGRCPVYYANPTTAACRAHTLAVRLTGTRGKPPQTELVARQRELY